MKHNFPYDKALEYFKSSVDGKGLDHRHLALAIQALEKQIPRKVKTKFATVNGRITCFETTVCPNCGEDFYVEDLGQTMFYNFCPNCGQAIKWK